MMDPLSDLLATLAVNRAAPLRLESRGPYAMRFAVYEHIKFGGSPQLTRLLTDPPAGPPLLGNRPCLRRNCRALRGLRQVTGGRNLAARRPDGLVVEYFEAAAS
jgi:hypothetical protein